MARQVGFRSMTQAGIDLGLGNVGPGGLGSLLLGQQVDQTEEERKRRQMGLSSMQSPAAQTLLGLGGPGGLGGLGRY